MGVPNINKKRFNTWNSNNNTNKNSITHNGMQSGYNRWSKVNERVVNIERGIKGGKRITRKRRSYRRKTSKRRHH
jgi:hypothetical protein